VVSLTFGDVASSTQLVRSGQLRALAVTGPHRAPLLLNVPTVAELGYPGFDAEAWHGVYAPAKTPAAIVQKLNVALALALKDPLVVDRLKTDGIEAVGASPAEFAAYTQEEIAKWGSIVREANITLSN
jgi:tripartite-type tricarboxylate transporter receptor subunit TctC